MAAGTGAEGAADTAAPAAAEQQGSESAEAAVEGIGSVTVIDPDTRASVTTREDLVLVVEYPNGDRVVRYVIHSCFRTTAIT